VLWVKGSGRCPRARFPVMSSIGVALLVFVQSLRYIVSGSGQPVERSPGESCTTAVPGGVGYGRSLKSGLILVV
jgi:hypothetical protein